MKKTQNDLIYAELHAAAVLGQTYRVHHDGRVFTIRGGWVPSTVLGAIGRRYGARLHDLKKQKRVRLIETKQLWDNQTKKFTNIFLFKAVW